MAGIEPTTPAKNDGFIFRDAAVDRTHDALTKRNMMKVLSTGLEPMTFALSERRATNCATRAVCSDEDKANSMDHN
jgi:hypothetical protein